MIKQAIPVMNSVLQRVNKHAKGIITTCALIIISSTQNIELSSARDNCVYIQTAHYHVQMKCTILKPLPKGVFSHS
jgi:hypothetical protein